MSGYALVEEVKKRTGLKSDNQVAEAIGKHRTNVSAWKRHKSDPDAESVLKLCMLGNIEPKKALELMQSGYARVSLMAVTAMLSLALLASHYYDLDTVYYVKFKVYKKTQHFKAEFTTYS